MNIGKLTLYILIAHLTSPIFGASDENINTQKLNAQKHERQKRKRKNAKDDLLPDNRENKTQKIDNQKKTMPFEKLVEAFKHRLLRHDSAGAKKALTKIKKQYGTSKAKEIDKLAQSFTFISIMVCETDSLKNYDHYIDFFIKDSPIWKQLNNKDLSKLKAEHKKKKKLHDALDLFYENLAMCTYMLEFGCNQVLTAYNKLNTMSPNIAQSVIKTAKFLEYFNQWVEKKRIDVLKKLKPIYEHNQKLMSKASPLIEEQNGPKNLTLSTSLD